MACSTTDLVDRLLARHRIGDLQELKPVGAYRTVQPCSSLLFLGEICCHLRSIRCRRHSACAGRRWRAASIKFIGQNELRIADIGRRERRSAGLLRRRLPDSSMKSRTSPSVIAFENALEALAAGHRHRHFDLRLMAGPALEILRRAPAAGRCPARTFRAGSALEIGSSTIEHRRNRPAHLLAIIDRETSRRAAPP